MHNSAHFDQIIQSLTHVTIERSFRRLSLCPCGQQQALVRLEGIRLGAGPSGSVTAAFIFANDEKKYIFFLINNTMSGNRMI